jgi:hypothetical protein
VHKDRFDGIDKDRLTQLYNWDVPIKIMANELGITYYRCREFIKALGLPPRTNTTIRVPVIIDSTQIKHMINEGLTDSQIADRLGIDVDLAAVNVLVTEILKEVEGEYNGNYEH